MQLLLIILDSLSSCLMLNSSSLWHEPSFYSMFEQCLEQRSEQQSRSLSTDTRNYASTNPAPLPPAHPPPSPTLQHGNRYGFSLRKWGLYNHPGAILPSHFIYSLAIYQSQDTSERDFKGATTRLK